jgi:hypothetical protein
MTNNVQRFCFLLATCSILGLGLGAATSQTAQAQCFDAQSTDRCFTDTADSRLVEGMVQGVMVGVCAAVAVSWNVLLKTDRH